MVRSVWFFAFTACSSCMEPAALPDTNGPAPEVKLAPAHGELAERVFHAVIEGLRGVGPGDVALFTGELSSYQVDRVREGELPANLLERRVPAVTWLDLGTSTLTLAPSRVLERGAHYTLAARGYGRLATIDVDPNPGLPLLERIWPPKTGRGGALVVLCSEHLAAPDASARIEPSGRQAIFSTHLGSDPLGRACGELLLDVEPEPEEFLVLPPELAGHLVDPEAWQFERSAVPPVAVCAPPRIALGPACADIEDDRLSIEPAYEPRLWIVANALGSTVSAVEANKPFGVRGLRPDSPEHLKGRAVGVGGEALAFEIDFTTQALRPRLVLNEVLSNSLGPEPASEWVEIVNDGVWPIELGGWFLQDAAGQLELPPKALEPGEHALLVRQDFAPRAGSDVMPAEGTSLIRVTALSKSGLSNAGEALTLTDPSGQFVSRFPPVPSKQAGVSVGRAHPDAFDDDASAFGQHAPPGASPGRANQIVTSAD